MNTYLHLNVFKSRAKCSGILWNCTRPGINGVLLVIPTENLWIYWNSLPQFEERNIKTVGTAASLSSESCHNGLRRCKVKSYHTTSSTFNTFALNFTFQQTDHLAKPMSSRQRWYSQRRKRFTYCVNVLRSQCETFHSSHPNQTARHGGGDQSHSCVSITKCEQNFVDVPLLSKKITTSQLGWLH